MSKNETIKNETETETFGLVHGAPNTTSLYNSLTWCGRKIYLGRATTNRSKVTCPDCLNRK